MSDTKHTPLPWEMVRIGLTSAFGIFHHNGGEPTYVGAHGAYAYIAELDARLIVTSVNARPKVEELVKIALNVLWGGSGKYTLAELESKAREVEAALGGKAE
ncbi:hypothetical protein LCGC14_1447130 [marine sediment metagenome]|uniref:Uncharacterized protein n=1 Tax=marine sediment metagenome TaxID=412755 RepID=A0A0F9MKU9_9ZZZZ